MGLKYPIDVDALKKAFSNSIMLKHPRFCSLMVKDPSNGADHWAPAQVSIDNHVIVHPNQYTSTSMASDTGLEDSLEASINAFLADISVSTPLSRDKPLWEVHVLEGLKCVVLRVHHAIGDGASMMAMFESCFGGECGDYHEECVGVRRFVHAKNKRSWKEKCVWWGFVKSVWFTLVFGLRLLGRFLYVKDEKCVFSGGDGVELWPRELVTLKFKIEDFKFVKKFIPYVTINDVLLGVISSGLSKYLRIKSPKDILHGLELTAIVVVNLRTDSDLQEMAHRMGSSSGPKSWGNKMGLVLQPIYCNEAHPLAHVRLMKAIMDQKKQSYEAQISYLSLKLITSYLGPKVASWCSNRILCNTTMLISNIIGPSKELAIGDNPVTFLRANISSQPHAMTVHMVSYGENMDVQVMVARDIIHDPKFLAECFQESLIEIKKCIC
ncbi:hypothetical protein vseg_012759 [Gypsophila vaccaria]